MAILKFLIMVGLCPLECQHKLSQSHVFFNWRYFNKLNRLRTESNPVVDVVEPSCCQFDLIFFSTWLTSVGRSGVYEARTMFVVDFFGLP